MTVDAEAIITQQDYFKVFTNQYMITCINIIGPSNPLRTSTRYNSSASKSLSHSVTRTLIQKKLLEYKYNQKR